jgi:protein-tyrosine phosphatase
VELLSVNAEGTLFVSGEIDDWEPLRRAKVDTIVDMDGDIDKGVPQSPNEILYVYYPILDEQLPDCDKLQAVGRLVAELVRTGHVVLVHCRMGFNRSNLVIATALTYLGMSGAQALAHLQKIRPGALYNENFARYVCGLEARAPG